MADYRRLTKTTQVLWHPVVIQQFVSSSECCVGDYMHQLITFDPKSRWISTSHAVTDSQTLACREEVAEISQNLQDMPKSPKTSSLSQQESRPLILSLTTLGLLIITTLTHNQGSHNLSQAILKLIIELFMKPAFKDLTENIPRLKRMTLSRLESFVKLCIQHCTLISDGGKIEDEGVVQEWGDVVEPLQRLLDGLIIDHLQESETWSLPIPEPSNAQSLRESFKQQKAAIYLQFNSYNFNDDPRYKAGEKQIIKQLSEEGGRYKDDLELQARIFYFSRFFHKVCKEDYQIWLSQQRSTTTRDAIAQNSTKLIGNITSNATSGKEKLKGEIISSGTKASFQDETAVLSDGRHIETVQSESLVSKHDLKSFIKDSSDKGSEMSNRDSDLKSQNEPCNSQIVSLPSCDNSSAVTNSDQVKYDTATSDASSSNPTNFDSAISDPMSSDPTNSVTSYPLPSDPMTPDPMSSDPPPYPTSFLDIVRLIESGQEIPGLETLDIKPTNADVTESKMEPVKKPWLK